MKDTTKRKLKKTIYAALVLSYILIITTVTTQAAVVFDAYKVTNPKIYYMPYNIDEEEITYDSGIQLTIGVDKISNSSVNLYMVYDIDPNKNMPFQVREIDGYGIYYDLQMQGTSTKQGVWTTQIYNTAGTLITVNIKATRQIYNNNQMIMVYNMTSSSSTMYNAIYYFDECEKYNDLHPGTILLSYLTLRGLTLSSNNNISVYEMTANEIIEDALGDSNQIKQDIYDALIKPFEPDNNNIPNTPSIPELDDAEDAAKEKYDEIYNENKDEIEQFIDDLDEAIKGYHDTNAEMAAGIIFNKIFALPYVVLIMPIAILLLLVKALLL